MFSVPIEKKEKWRTITYKLRFTDSVRFMANSLSRLTDNLEEGRYKSKCKDCRSSLEYMTAKDALLTFKCVDFNKTYEKKFDEDLFKRLQNIYKFCYGNVNKFCLVLWKGAYP